MSTNPFVEKNLEFLIECMDDLSMEQQKVRGASVIPASTQPSLHGVGSFKFLTITVNFVCAVPVLLQKSVKAASPATGLAAEEKVWGS